MSASGAYHGLRGHSVSNVKSFLLRRGKGRDAAFAAPLRVRKYFCSVCGLGTIGDYQRWNVMPP